MSTKIDTETDKATEAEERIDKDLDILKTSILPNITDGSLLVVTVGNEKTPATQSDMERVAAIINEIFEGTVGVCVLVAPHIVKVEKLSLPSLRNLQSKVVNSWNQDEPIAFNLDDLGVNLEDFQ